MAIWTNETAGEALRNIINEISALKQNLAFSSQHSRWLANTLPLLEQVFGEVSRYYLSSANLKWVKTGSFLVGGPADPEGSWNPQ